MIIDRIVLLHPLMILSPGTAGGGTARLHLVNTPTSQSAATSVRIGRGLELGLSESVRAVSENAERGGDRSLWVQKVNLFWAVSNNNQYI